MWDGWESLHRAVKGKERPLPGRHMLTALCTGITSFMILSPFQNEGHRWSIVIPTMAQPESSHVKKMIVSPYCLLLALDGIPEKSQNQKELGVVTISTSESQSMSTQAESHGKAAPREMSRTFLHCTQTCSGGRQEGQCACSVGWSLSG